MADLTALVLSFLKAIGKYRWHAIIIAWVVALAGWAVVLKLPNQYEVSARVYVDTQNILKPLLSGMTMLPNPNQQIMFMRRTLFSRPNVERAMRMVDLDVKAANSKEHDEMVDKLMSQIRMAGTERDDIYTIAYTAPNPKLGKDVVQAFLTIFVEGSFGGKKQDSEKAIVFIDDQIRNYEEKLAAAESDLKDFKIKYMGMLPGQSGDFTSRLSATSEALNQARLELAEAEQSRNAIQRQMLGTPAAPGERSLPAPVDAELEARITSITRNLDNLRLQFTEQHPDIIANRRLLDQLLARKAAESKNYKPGLDTGTAYSPMQQQLNVSLSEAQARVAALQARVSEYASRLSRLRSQSTEVPEIEAELSRLNRDYGVYRDNYQKLVQRRETAKLSGELSSATDMMTFRVIEPPTAPPLPSGPNRLRLFSMVFAGALAAGLAGAFLFSQLRPTFLSQASLRDTTGLPILGSISMNWTSEQTVRRKRRLYALGASILFLCGTYGAGVAAILVRPSL